ncbi:MFS transporter [Nitrospira sp. Kam-Ns4a]
MEERGLLFTREFSLVWWGQLVSQIGDGVSKLAMLWFVYAITGSPLKTTVIGLLQTVPPILLGPLIGVLVDRLPRKALLIGLVPCLISVEAFTVERLYVLVFLHALAAALFGPALWASVPFLVPRDQFTAANALFQGTTSLGVIVGPLLSGLGIAALGSQEVLCINALTYAASAACFIPLRLPRGIPLRPAESPVAATLRDLAEGFHFALVTQRLVLWLTLTASCYTFGTSAFSTLFPVFGRRMLDLGPVEVGYLWSSFGIGLLLMSVGLLRLTRCEIRKRVLTISMSSVISGAALVGLVWASDRVVAVGLMVLVGVGAGTLTPIAWGVLQELSPTHLVGRVLAIYTTGAMTSAISGMTVFGWITQEFGERWGIIGIGMVLGATGLVAAAISRLPSISPTEPTALSPSCANRKAHDQVPSNACRGAETTCPGPDKLSRGSSRPTDAAVGPSAWIRLQIQPFFSSP